MNFWVVQTGFRLGDAVFQIMRKLDEQIALRAHFSAVSLKCVGHKFPCLSVQVINKVPVNTDFSYVNQLLRLQETIKWGTREEVCCLVFRDYIKEKGNRHTYKKALLKTRHFLVRSVQFILLNTRNIKEATRICRLLKIENVYCSTNKVLLARSQNCEKRLLASSCLSVRPHGTTQLSSNGSSKI